MKNALLRKIRNFYFWGIGVRHNPWINESKVRSYSYLPSSIYKETPYPCLSVEVVTLETEVSKYSDDTFVGTWEMNM